MGGFGGDAIVALPLLAAVFWIPALAASVLTGTVTAIAVAVRSRRARRLRPAQRAIAHPAVPSRGCADAWPQPAAPPLIAPVLGSPVPHGAAAPAWSAQGAARFPAHGPGYPAPATHAPQPGWASAPTPPAPASHPLPASAARYAALSDVPAARDALPPGGAAPRRALAIDPAPAPAAAATMQDLLGDAPGPAPREAVPGPPPAPPRAETPARLGIVERDDPPRVVARAVPPALAFDVQRIDGLWMLLPDGGAPVELTAEVAIVGRRPVADPRYPGAQLVTVRHETVSKTHARIERRGSGWLVTDLASTNGVVVIDGDGTGYDATPGSPARVRERLRLGEMEVRVSGAA